MSASLKERARCAMNAAGFKMFIMRTRRYVVIIKSVAGAYFAR